MFKAASAALVRAFVNNFGLWFFIGFQILISWILLSHRTGNIPVGFDDVYSYLYGIKKVLLYGTPVPNVVNFYPEAHLDYVSYNAIFGYLARALSLEPERLFYLSFYFGKIILGIVFYWWLKSLNIGSAFRNLCLIFLATYAGNGLIHGFFWVVPSFWALIVFFALIAINKKLHVPYFLNLIMCLVYINIHPLAKISIVLLLSYLGIELIFERTLSKYVLRLFLIMSLAVLLTEAVGCRLAGCRLQTPFEQVVDLKDLKPDEISAKDIYFALVPVNTAKLLPASVTPVFSYLSKIIGQFLIHISLFWGSVFPGFGGIWKNYISSFALFYPLFLYFPYWVFRCIKTSSKQVGYWYLAVLFGILGLIWIPQDYRLLIFLWPLTLTVFAYGFKLSFEQFRKQTNILKKAFHLMGLACLGTYWVYQSSFSLNFVNNISKQNDYAWDNVNCPQYLLNKTRAEDYNLFFNSFSGISAFTYYGLDQRHLSKTSHLISNFKNIKEAYNKFYVVSENQYFEGDSDSVYVNDLKSELNHLIGREFTQKWTDCGYFTITEYLSKDYGSE